MGKGLRPDGNRQTPPRLMDFFLQSYLKASLKVNVILIFAQKCLDLTKAAFVQTQVWFGSLVWFLFA